MSYKEKQTIVTILSGLFILIAYIFYAYNKVQSGLAAPDDMKFWATAILSFIVIGIVATILIQIVFHILLSISLAVKNEVQKEMKKEMQKEMQKEIQNEVQKKIDHEISNDQIQDKTQHDSHHENFKKSYDEMDIEKELELEMVEDEMDQLIELKATRIGFAIAGIGFVVSLVSLVLDYAPAVMLNIAFFSFSIGSMIEGIVKLFYYKRGIQNG